MSKRRKTSARPKKRKEGAVEPLSFLPEEEMEAELEDGSKGARRRGLSGWWAGRFGSVRSWWGRGDALIPYIEALRASRRITRIVHGETQLVTWRKMNLAENPEYVVLDSGPLEHKEWEETERLDAVIGDAMVQSSLRATIPPEHVANPNSVRSLVQKDLRGLAFFRLGARYNDSSPLSPGVVVALLAKITVQLYLTAAHIMAAQRVAEPFPGFRGYLDQERDWAHRPDSRKKVAGQIATALTQGEPFRAAAGWAMWNALRPGDPLTRAEVEGLYQRILGVSAGGVAEEVEEVAGRAAEALREGALQAGGSSELAGAAVRALGILLDLLDPPEEEKQDSAGEQGEGSGQGEGESGSSGPKRTMEALDRAARLSEAMARHLKVHPEGGDRGAEEARKIERMEGLDFRKEERSEEMEEILQESGARDMAVHSLLADEDKDGYQGALREVRPLIDRLRDVLSFRQERAAMDELGLRRGRIDEGGIYKLGLDDPRVFTRTEIQAAPQVHFGVLVDESGSMCALGGADKTRADLARESAVLIEAAVRDMRGVHLSIWGHTADDRRYGADGALVFRYIERGRGSPHRLGDIQARGNNADGHALAYCVERMGALSEPGEEQILVTILDGHPRAWDYGGVLAEKHVRGVCEAARRRGIQILAIGIGEGLERRAFERMYGAGNYVMVPEVKDLPRLMGRLLTRALRTGSV